MAVPDTRRVSSPETVYRETNGSETRGMRIGRWDRGRSRGEGGRWGEENTGGRK